MRTRRICFPGLILTALLLCCGPALAGSTVYTIPLNMPIHPLAAEVVERGLAEARESGAAVVVLELNTPGGLMSSMEAIIEDIVASPVPVVGYVGPSGASADSAGFFILMACDLAVMAPGTNTGAAHPVPLMGEEPDGESHMANKIEEAAAARMRALVERRGRNVELAERAVTESLSFTTGEALEGGLIEAVADDFDALIADLDGRRLTRLDGTETQLSVEAPAVERYELSARQRALAVIAMPSVAYLLLLLGGLGLYVEYSHPGLILPAVFGLVCLTIAAYGMSILPVNYLGLALILLGVVLLALEVKVTSYGLLSAGGLGALILGSLILFEGPIPELRVGLKVVLPAALLVALVVMGLMAAVVKASRQRRQCGPEGLVGEQGRVLSALGPDGGRVFVHGENWQARSAVPLESGQQIRVVSMKDNLTLEVEPLE